MPSAPIPTFLRFFYEHGLGSVQLLLDHLNHGLSITEIARIFNTSPSRMRRVVHAITDVRYIIKEELIEWIEHELRHRTEITEAAARYRTKILRLASLDGEHSK